MDADSGDDDKDGLTRAFKTSIIY